MFRPTTPAIAKFQSADARVPRSLRRFSKISAKLMPFGWRAVRRRPNCASTTQHSAFVLLYMTELVALLLAAYVHGLPAHPHIGPRLCGLLDVVWSFSAVTFGVLVLERHVGIVAACCLQAAACVLAAAEMLLLHTLDQGLNSGLLRFGVIVLWNVSNSGAILAQQMRHLWGSADNDARLTIACVLGALLHTFVGFSRVRSYRRGLERRRGVLWRPLVLGSFTWTVLWPTVRKGAPAMCASESCSVFLRLINEATRLAIFTDRSSALTLSNPHAVRAVPGALTRERQGVVLLILESVGADALSPLYVPRDKGGHGSTAPFLSWLAGQSGSLAAAAHFAALPNTNKMLLELVCGVTPEPSTDWEEYTLGKALVEECLPRIWRMSTGGRSLFVSSSSDNQDSPQRNLGFDVVMGASDLRRACKRGTFARQCRRLHVELTGRCALRLRKLKGGTMRDRLHSLLQAHAASQWSHSNACGILKAGPPMNRSQLRDCLEDPCMDQKDGGAAPTGWQKATRATGDLQMLEPTLAFAAAEAAAGRPFLVVLLTTATHYPYHPSVLERPVGDNGTRVKGRGFVGRSYEGRKTDYLSRVSESDKLARLLFAGLRERNLSQTLFVATGDHGEGFHFDGTSKQHGSCVFAECTRVPFIMHDPTTRGSGTRNDNTTPNWLFGPQRHADIFPTVLNWAGFELSNSTAKGLLRQGQPIGVVPSSAGRCISIFAFFDQRRRAVACSTTEQLQEQDTTFAYSVHDPRYDARPRHSVLEANPAHENGIRQSRSSTSTRVRKHFAQLDWELSTTRQLHAQWRKLVDHTGQRKRSASVSVTGPLLKTRLTCLLTSIVVGRGSPLVPEGC